MARKNERKGLAAKVYGLRAAKGMSQVDLSRKTNIKQATISRIESGEIKEPRLSVLKELSKGLGVTVDFLVGRTDELTPSDILKSDPEAEVLFRGYEKLSAEGKDKLRDFLGWLREKEQKKG